MPGRGRVAGATSRLARVALRGVESLWAAGFALAPSRGAARWSTPGGRRVLCVAPHPDDETAGCGGTLARHAQEGDEVRVVVVTDGRRSRARGLAPDEMARRRREEARAGTRALGASLVLLDLPEGEWSAAAAEEPLAGALRDFAPDLLYLPSRLDFHPEHVKVAHLLGAVLPRAVAPETEVRLFGIQVPLGAPLASLVCDVTGIEALPRAMAAYETQAWALRCTLRARRYAAARHRAGRLAEELHATDAARYAAAHAGPADPEPWRKVRSVRPRPFFDPLAYLVGRGERRRLAALLGPPGPHPSHEP